MAPSSSDRTSPFKGGNLGLIPFGATNKLKMDNEVSLKLALLLKTHKIVIPSYKYYTKNNELKENNIKLKGHWYCILAPNYFDVILWIYNNYNVFIWVSPSSIYNNKFRWNLKHEEIGIDYEDNIEELKTAYEIAITHFLKTLLNKQYEIKLI